MRKLLSLFLLAALLLTGCQGGEQTDEGAGTQNGVFTLAMRTPQSLDPLRAEHESSALVFDLVYDSLVYVDREMRPVPYLAESCTFSPDGLTISFALHDGVLWQDGAAFTAQDVEHTIGRIRSLGEGCIYYDRLESISRVVVRDMLHFDLELTAPHVMVLNLLDFPIVPCHRTDLDTNMVGTGQYRLESYTPQKNMTLVKNDDWAIGEPPSMEKIYVKMLERSADTANMVKIGEVTAVAASMQTVGGLGIGENMKITHYPTLEYVFVGFNMASTAVSSKKIRGAVSAAMDRARMIEDAFLGYGSAAVVPVPPTAYMYIGEEADKTTRDIERAKALLFEAGYNLIDGEMRRQTDEENEPLVLSLLVNEENEARKKCAAILAENLAEIGVKVDIETVPFSDYLARLSAGEFSMYLGGCLFSANLSYDFLLGEERQVENGYASAEMEEALYHLLPQKTDETVKAAYQQFQSVFLRDLPLSGICFLDGALVHTASLRGIENLAASKLYRNIGQWYLE